MFAILFTVVLNSTTSFMWIRCCSKYEVTSSNTSIASLKLFNFTEEEGCLCHHHLLIRLIKKARFPIITHSNTHCKVIIITQIFIHWTAIIYIILMFCTLFCIEVATLQYSLYHSVSDS